MMKKILLFLLTLMPVMLFSGCSSSDDSGSEPVSILNTWSGENNGNQVFITFNSNATAIEYVLHSDGTATLTQFTYTNEADGFEASGVRFKTKSASGSWTDWDYPTDEIIVKYQLSGSSLTRITTESAGSQTITTLEKATALPADAPAYANDIATWEF